MTKKDYLSVAKAINSLNIGPKTKAEIAYHISDKLASSVPKLTDIDKLAFVLCAKHGVEG